MFPQFSFVETVNQIALDRDASCSFGGKSFQFNQVAQEMQMLKLRIAELESQMKELEKSAVTANSFLPSSPP